MVSSFPTYSIMHALRILLITFALLSPSLSAVRPAALIYFGDDVKGTSSVPGYEGWLEASFFYHRLDEPDGLVNLTPSGQDFRFESILSQASPKLHEKCLNGTVIPVVDIRLRPLPGERHSPFAIILHRVAIRDYHLNISESGPTSTESFALAYDRVEWIYRKSQPDGPVTKEETVAFNFDLGSFFAAKPDDDRDSIENALDADDDNDGIPDTYEQANGLDPIFSDADEDLDKDSTTNRYEWITGTAANDGSSSYDVSLSVVQPAPREPATSSFSFPTMGGRKYRLLAYRGIPSETERPTVIDEFVVAKGTGRGLAKVPLPETMAASFDRLFFTVEVSLP